MKTLLNTLILLALFSCTTVHEQFKAEEHRVSGGEQLEEILANRFPQFILSDPIQKDNLMIMLKNYNAHLPSFPQLTEGDVIYLSRPLSPYIPD